MPRKSSASTKKVKSPAKGSKAKDTLSVYQFKITLLGFKPLIWRRIQVQDCTLDKLHQHVQTSMGWTNSHLHHFRIGKQFYGDPELMQENFGEMGCGDSTATMLSAIVPKDGKRFSFFYEYDFGDSWEHEIRFEGTSDPIAGTRYPRCVEGQRACPPEDCGGVWGYADLLEAIADNKHENHDEMLEWLGGSFDADAFDVNATTKCLRQGVHDWR